MKILITGGLGHIGSYILRNFKIKNKKITFYIVDNLISQRYCSLFDLPKRNNYKFINQDISTYNYEKLPKANIVIHLAAKTDAAQSDKHEKEFSKNFNATKNIINYCLLNKSKLIFASTTSVYGPQSDFVDENCLEADLNPQSPYAKIKLNEEKIIAKKMTNNFYVIVRFGTVFGYAQGIRFHTAVNKFCFQASIGLPLTVWKTAINQYRPYLSLKDLNLSIESIIKEKNYDNEIYNVLSFNLTVSDILKVIKKTYSKININYVNHPIMNQMSYKVSNAKFLNKFKKIKYDENPSEGIDQILKKLNSFKIN